MAVKPIRQVANTITPTGDNLVLVDDGVSMGKATLSAAVTSVADGLVDTKIESLNLDTASQKAIEYFATALQGSLADSAVQPGVLATVATSGDYGDLSGRPTLGTAAATDIDAYATAAQGETADSAVQSLVAGTGIAVDASDPNNPTVSVTGDGLGDMLKEVYDTNNKESDAFDSANHAYDNAASGLDATTVQGAIDEIAGAVDDLDGNKLDASAGAVVQSAVGTYTATTALTAQFPSDNTKPQITEGTQIISVSITPKSATNKLRVRFSGTGSLSAAGNAVSAIFNGASDAIHVAAVTAAATTYLLMTNEVEFVAGTTSAVTISVRVGPLTAISLYLNAITGTQLFGGAMASTLIVEEILA